MSKFFAIGVGPGDPELLTLKAVSTLRQAQVLYHTGPEDRDGLAYRTMQSFLAPEQRVHTVDLLMVKGHDDWRRRYGPAVERIAADCLQGLTVAFASEGDPTLYSTASYIWQLLRERYPGIPIEVIPGVSSITAAAARAALPLAQKDERLAVLPANYGWESVQQALRDFDSVALLKLGQGWSEILRLLEPQQPIVYAEHVTTANEFVTSDREAMRGRAPAYFSLLLVKKSPASSAAACGLAGAAAKPQAAGEGVIHVVGLGPGDPRHLTLAARDALQAADAIVGYGGYLELLRPLGLGAELFPRPIGEERQRAELALELARAGRNVALVSSGDAGIYGMAGILLELADQHVQIEIMPGVTAASAAASLLGAPLGHDFACVSLSDLLTPWDVIEQRLDTAGRGDFVVVLYNPISRKRTWQLPRARDLLLAHRPAGTPVGLVDQAYRPGQRAWLTTLGELGNEGVTMQTTIIVGSRQTRLRHGRMLTPRGYATSAGSSAPRS